jgi:predicted transcriptional regulator of viral defense system
MRIKKGLYTFNPVHRRRPLLREILANLIYGPSYVSLDYALRFHGLIPEQVTTVTSVTVGRSRQFDTPFGVFAYHGITVKRYAIGATLQTESDNGLSYLIASAEKALLDKAWKDTRFSGRSRNECRTYLVDDLRIDKQRLAQLQRGQLKAIAQVYESAKIDRLVETLCSFP